MTDGFDGLRLDAVVSSNDQYSDIRCMSASGTHCRECFVSRCIQEYDLLTIDFNFGCTDVLSDPSGFLGSYVRFTDRIQQGRLTVVNVTHNSDDRSSRLQIFFFIFEGFDSFLFCLFLDLADSHLQTHFFSQQHYCIFIQILVYVSHNAHLHQRHDDL